VKKRWEFYFAFSGAALLLAAVFIAGMASGYISLSPGRLLATLAGRGTDAENLILYEFRLPRMLVAFFAGIGFAVSGAVLQSMTHNPLADPGILGINSGAGLMVAVFISFFTSEPSSFLYILPVFALLGGIAAAVLIYVLSFKKGERIQPERMVLTGAGLSSAFSGAMIALASHFNRDQYDFIARWLAGTIWGDDWAFVLALLPWIAVLVPVVFFRSNTLDVLSLHEHAAVGLGVHIGRENLLLGFTAAALASVSVSVTGGIGFIGLMAPHIAKRLVGPRHRFFLPVAALLGAVLLLGADTIGRVILDPSGIPAGIVVTVIGAPYFLYLMVKN